MGGRNGAAEPSIYASGTARGAANQENDFVVRHARMTLRGFGRFDLAYFRHTDKWFDVYRGLTAAECFREIEGNEIFWPTTDRKCLGWLGGRDSNPDSMVQSHRT